MVALSSNAVPLAGGAAGEAAFARALADVCGALAEDIVRNGEGVQHVIRVKVARAPSAASARAIGKAIVNSPLFKCAVAGNDPNVGRLVAAIGKCLGGLPDGAKVDTKAVRLTMGGRTIFADGVFALDGEAEAALVAHLKSAQLWGACGVGRARAKQFDSDSLTPSLPTRSPARPESSPRVSDAATPQRTSGSAGYALRAADVSFATPIQFPPHERCVEVGVDLGVAGGADATVLGADLTHEYVAENADYRS